MSRPALLALALLSSLACHSSFGAGIAPAVAQEPGTDQSAGPGLTVEQARVAATRILEAVKSGDANARYAQFSEELKALTSPAMVQATIRSQPKVLSYELLSVRSGLSGSTVEAELTTTQGPRVLFLVLNGNGQVARFYVDRTDDATSKVAEQFVRALSTGHFISAHSFLSPQFQKDITPQALEDKWLTLQRSTGLFQKMGRVVEAEITPDGRLVLVNVLCNGLSVNLFVILDANNQVIGVDFPSDPAP